MEGNLLLVYLLLGLITLFLQIGFATKENKITGLILPIAFLITAIYYYIKGISNGIGNTEEIRVMTTIGIEGFIISIIVYLIIRLRRKGGK